MKHLFSLTCLIVVVSSVYSQEEVLPAPGNYLYERLEGFEGYRIEEILVNESFAEGIPVSWTNQNFNNSSEETQAHWEYRGPTTTPSNMVGTRGSCEESGTGIGVPILSPTADDGFVIFDSDYWDSTAGLCPSIGTGIDPGPHNAYLTTESYDLSGYDYVGLTYNQYLRNHQATMAIQASVNGGEFQDLHVAQDGFNRSSQVRVIISDIVANMADVRFRFAFEGLYYYWMIDDFTLVKLEENNLELQTVHHGDFYSASATYDGLDYFKYPLNMMSALDFNGSVKNQGGVVQSGVTLAVQVTQGDIEIENVNSSVGNLSPGQTSSIDAGIVNLASEMGEYEVSYEFTQNEEEVSPENNSVSKSIEITEYTMARDEGLAQSIYTPTGDLANVPYEVGTVYYITQSDMFLHSISAGVSMNSVGGANCYAKLYEIEVDPGIVLTEVASTGIEYTHDYQLNNFGEEKMMVFDFEEPVALTQGTSYLAVVRSLDGAESVTFSLSGDSPENTSFVVFENGSPIYYLFEVPMIRMNFGLVTGVEDEEALQNNWDVEVFPNPSIDNLTVRYELQNSSEVIVGLFDVTGKHIEDLYMGTNPKGTHDLKVDVSTLSSGNYIIKVMSEYGIVEKKIVVQ